MKSVSLFLLFLSLVCVDLSAQSISIKRSVLTPKQNNTFHLNHSAARNSRTGIIVIVWERVSGNSHRILGRVINSQGNHGSGLITIAAGPDVSNPHIAYNPERNEFLVAYDNNAEGRRTHTDIFVRRLNSLGRPSGPSIRVTTDEVSQRMWNFEPRIIYNPHDSNYSLVWVREFVSQTDQSSAGLVGATLTSDNASRGIVGMIQRSTAEFDWPVPLDVQIHPSANKLLAVFTLVPTGVNGTRANYHLANVNTNFAGITPGSIKKINNAAVALSNDFVMGAQMALFDRASGFLVFSDNKSIKRRRIDSAGRLSGPALAAFRSPQSNIKMFYPSVAFSEDSTNSRGILIASENIFSSTGSAKIWAQPIDSSGTALGAAQAIDTTSNSSTAASLLVVAGPQTARTGFQFTSLYSLSDFQPPGQTFRNSTIVRLALNVLLPS